MRFPLRERLFLEPDSVPFVGDFSDELLRAYNSSLDAIPTATQSEADLLAWESRAVETMISRFGAHSAVGNALLGIAFIVVSEAAIAEQWRQLDSTFQGKIPPNRSSVAPFSLATKGQQRLVKAILRLHPDDLKILFAATDRLVQVQLKGAMSVARLSTVLSEHGTCWLGTPSEDAEWGIDLLFQVGDARGLCIQVKTGSPHVCRAEDSDDPKAHRLLNGISAFNRKFGLRWIPVVATIGFSPRLTSKPRPRDARLVHELQQLLKYS